MVFYARYPNKASEHVDNPLRFGYFDDLKQYVDLGIDPSKKESIVLQRHRRRRNHYLCLDKGWFERHQERAIPRLQHVRREAIQNDCLRFRESVRSRNIAGSQRFTKSWFWDSSWVLWEMNVDSTTTNEHSSESSNVWMVPLLAYLFESLLITNRLGNACISKCKLCHMHM